MLQRLALSSERELELLSDLESTLALVREFAEPVFHIKPDLWVNAASLEERHQSGSSALSQRSTSLGVIIRASSLAWFRLPHKLLIAFLRAKQQSPPCRQARRTSGTSQNSNLSTMPFNSLAHKQDSLGRSHCMDCSHGSMTQRNCSGIRERGTSPLQFHVQPHRSFTLQGMRRVNILQVRLRGTSQVEEVWTC